MYPHRITLGLSILDHTLKTRIGSSRDPHRISNV
jgi:hypothetical protein